MHLDGKQSERGTSKINHVCRQITMEMMRQKKLWALLHPLAKPLVNYRHQNKAGIGSCNCPLIHWQSWKKSIYSTSHSAIPSWKINEGDFASKSFKNSQYIQKYSRTITLSLYFPRNRHLHVAVQSC